MSELLHYVQRKRNPAELIGQFKGALVCKIFKHLCSSVFVSEKFLQFQYCFEYNGVEILRQHKVNN